MIHGETIISIKSEKENFQVDIISMNILASDNPIAIKKKNIVAL